MEETTIIEGSFATRMVLCRSGGNRPPHATIGNITQPQPARPTIPPATLGDGRGEVPGGDLGAKENAVELAAARRGPGRRPRLKPGEANAKTAERMRTVRRGILRNSLREMSCRQDISSD